MKNGGWIGSKGQVKVFLKDTRKKSSIKSLAENINCEFMYDKL